MRRPGIIAAAGVAAALAAVGGALLAANARRSTPDRPAAAAATSPIGGPFRLVTHEGKPLSDADLRGRPFAIFFGFTNCPEVCPTTLWEISESLRTLGEDANELRVLFVTLDPARDSAETLKRYLQSFDPRIIGLTGSDDEIARAAKDYRVFWEKVPGSDGDYTLNHSAVVYLMDRAGALADVSAYQEPEDRRLAKLRKLVAKRSE